MRNPENSNDTMTNPGGKVGRFRNLSSILLEESLFSNFSPKKRPVFTTWKNLSRTKCQACKDSAGDKAHENRLTGTSGLWVSEDKTRDMGAAHRTTNKSTQKQAGLVVHPSELGRSTTVLVGKQKKTGHQAEGQEGLEENTAASTTFCLTSSFLCFVQTKAEESYLALLYTSSRMKVSSLDASAIIPNPLLRKCSLISMSYFACFFPSLIEALSDTS